VEDEHDWMSDGSELQRRDAATGNMRQPTIVSWNDGTVDEMMTSQVGDDEAEAGRRRVQDRSGMVTRDHTADETP